MSTLRRFVQTKHASSPANSSAAASPSTPTPASGSASRGLPTTPRARLSFVQSPALGPSLSASEPFDWVAARSRQPAPYSTPTKRLSRLRNGETPSKTGTPHRQKVVRKKPLLEKITSLPSEIAFHWEVSTSHIEFFAPEKLAWGVGGLMHFVHFCTRIAQIRRIPDSDLGWEDMYREDEGEDWFNWTIPVTVILVAAALVNTAYLFTRTRLYTLRYADEPVSSPNAKFVSREHTPAADDDPDAPRTGLARRVLQHLWTALVLFVRFLLNLTPPKGREVRTAERVQVLEKWDPREFEMVLFAIYSPVHTLLWLAFTSANWIIVFTIMALVSVQVSLRCRALMKSFLVQHKDNMIIQSEVMHEYNVKFVDPRIHPVRRDAAVMTHQAEMVDRPIWQ
ncbi:hypothetical protein EIP86_000451 [Pleurotus ostreatoroseus]|nr:hypothetical protein EIP86_000451 [Pleurotus ostreatoroseus]